MTGSDQPGASTAMRAQVLTCSFRGDFDVCRMLCESMDRFVSPDIGHSLFVPEQDMAMFAPLANARRVIRSQESLLPRGFWKLPLPSKEWRRRLFLPRRDVFLTPYSLPVRGWIAQQIMKLAASEEAETEIIVHIDSDNMFVRPLTMEHLIWNGTVRFYRNPEKVPLDSHRRWHVAASRLLGLPVSDFHGAEYINPLVVWRRSVLRAVTRQIGEVAGTDWRIALARTPHFAEYVLYGAFADKVLGHEAAGLAPTDQTLCHARWSGGFSGPDDEAAFAASLEPHHVTLLVQSTVAMSPDDLRRLHGMVCARARDQDSPKS